MLKGAVDNQSNVLIYFSLTLAYICTYTYIRVLACACREEPATTEEEAAAERKEAKQTETITKRAAPSPQSRAEQQRRQQQRGQPAVSLCVPFLNRSHIVPLTRRRGGQSLNALLQGLWLHTPTTFGADCGL